MFLRYSYSGDGFFLPGMFFSRQYLFFIPSAFRRLFLFLEEGDVEADRKRGEARKGRRGERVCLFGARWFGIRIGCP